MVMNEIWIFMCLIPWHQGESVIAIRSILRIAFGEPSWNRPMGKQSTISQGGSQAPLLVKSAIFGYKRSLESQFLKASKIFFLSS